VVARLLLPVVNYSVATCRCDASPFPKISVTSAALPAPPPNVLEGKLLGAKRRAPQQAAASRYSSHKIFRLLTQAAFASLNRDLTTVSKTLNFSPALNTFVRLARGQKDN
jgi:hypothetical protein